MAENHDDSEVNDDEVTIAGVRLTSPDKVLFPEQGTTKRDLAEYYERNAECLLRFVAGRPLTIVRCPEGREGECFFQKHHTKGMPEALAAVTIEEKDGTKAPYILANDPAGLVAAAQIGALELHIWSARADQPERPERLIFDIDPDKGLEFAEVRKTAFALRDKLQNEAELNSFPLLTGGKGIHVIAPIERRSSWEDVKNFASGLAKAMVDLDPDRYIATASKEKREGKIFIDYLRNERGSTAIAPYSPRARKGAPVATPVTWDELSGITSAAVYTIKNISQRLAQLQGDPWADYGNLRQRLTKETLRRFS